MRAYLLPFGDLIAWCLMPNHFHWLFNVKSINIDRKEFREHLDNVETQRRLQKYGDKALPVERANTRFAKETKPMTLNNSIGDLQKGYGKAINNEKGWSGSLFRGCISKVRERSGDLRDEGLNARIIQQKGSRPLCHNPNYPVPGKYEVIPVPGKYGVSPRSLRFEYSQIQKESIADILA